ncbi:MAG: phosphoribosyltransferase family protein [Candidatus Aegiribacteria sp.]
MSIHVYRHVHGPIPAFQDRHDAGRQLASWMKPRHDPEAVVLALPRGGVPVAQPLTKSLGGSLQPVTVRKLPIPGSPEMGFGAMAIDGTVVLNQRVVANFGIDEETVKRVTAEVRDEIERRALKYAGTASPPEVRDRHVFIVDDGLATGYSMLVAGRMVSRREPASLTMAVPVSPESSLRMINGMFDQKYCLLAQEYPSFAVASFYRDFHEMSDREVMEMLQSV